MTRAPATKGERLSARDSEGDAVVGHKIDQQKRNCPDDRRALVPSVTFNGTSAPREVRERSLTGCMLVGFIVSIVLGGHAKEFLTGQGVVTKATQHAASNQVGAGLVDATGRHAVMLRLDDYPNALRSKASLMVLAICAVIFSCICKG